jgi:hypothetical protein
VYGNNGLLSSLILKMPVTSTLWSPEKRKLGIFRREKNKGFLGLQESLSLSKKLDLRKTKHFYNHPSSFCTKHVRQNSPSCSVRKLAVHRLPTLIDLFLVEKPRYHPEKNLKSFLEIGMNCLTSNTDYSGILEPVARTPGTGFEMFWASMSRIAGCPWASGFLNK